VVALIGPIQSFLKSAGRIGNRNVGDARKIRAAEPRKQKHDRRDAELILEAAGGKTLSGNS
jgi:hypothetical protein